MSTLGYVVIEWNQASHKPSIACGGDLHDQREDAKGCVDQLIEETKTIGRRERYTIATVEWEDEFE